MIKFRSRKLFKASSKPARCAAAASGAGSKCRREIEWELRPGGMLVQKREQAAGAPAGCRDGLIIVRVVAGFRWHDVSVGATSTFGELKELAGTVTGVEPGEQRLLFRGKEKEDCDHLHMAGVKEGDKVLLVEDPAIKERKLNGIKAALKPWRLEPLALLPHRPGQG